MESAQSNSGGQVNIGAEQHHAVEEYHRAILDLGKQTMRFRHTLFQTREYGMHSLLSRHVEWIIYLYDGLRESMKYILDEHLTSISVRTRILRTWARYLERGELDRLPMWYDLHGFLGAFARELYSRFDFYEWVLRGLRGRWISAHDGDANSSPPEWIMNDDGRGSGRCWQMPQELWESDSVKFETRVAILMRLKCPTVVNRNLISRDHTPRTDAPSMSTQEEPVLEFDALERDIIRGFEATGETVTVQSAEPRASRILPSRARSQSLGAERSKHSQASLSHRGPLSYRQALIYEQ